jgi:beta-glucanase (GH16 family)
VNHARHRALLLSAALLILGSGVRGEVPVWSEEFEAGPSLDPVVWSYDLGDGCASGICGWGNSEFQVYTDDPANVRVEAGELIITALRHTEGGPSNPTFTSARIKTKDKLAIRYGTIEARVRLPDLADGLWPAFWMMGNNIDEVGWPACGEIDIFEMGSAGAIAEGVVNRRVGSHAHWDVDGEYAGYGESFTAGSDLHDLYHVYRMEWTPDAIVTYIDGIRIWTFDISDPQSFSGEEFHLPQFLLLNMAVGGTYTGITGSPNRITATFPAEYRVDWIRVYDNGFTEFTGSAAPIRLSASRIGMDVELSFDTQDGLTYEVLYKTAIDEPSWTLLELVDGDGTTQTVRDPVGSPARFYTVEVQR